MERDVNQRALIGAVAVLLVAAAIVASTPTPDALTARSASSGTPAATPAEPLPLYTQIPVSEARNVVGRVTIELTDRGFVPSRFENAINQPITVTLVNTGTRLHTFTIDELGVDVAVAPGETTTFTIPSPPRLKRYIYYSDTPEDRALGMTGIMTIFI
jgi:hypothetical protein